MLWMPTIEEQECAVMELTRLTRSGELLWKIDQEFDYSLNGTPDGRTILLSATYKDAVFGVVADVVRNQVDRPAK